MLEEAEGGSEVPTVWGQGTCPPSQTARTRLAAAIDDVPEHLGAAPPELLGVGRGHPRQPLIMRWFVLVSPLKHSQRAFLSLCHVLSPQPSQV